MSVAAAYGDDHNPRVITARTALTHGKKQQVRLNENGPRRIRVVLDQTHPGVITRVKDFGFFVELQDCFVRGLVSAESLHDDWYEFIEEKHLIQGKKKGRTFQLGDKVNVKIVNIDLGKKEVDLEIV